MVICIITAQEAASNQHYAYLVQKLSKFLVTTDTTVTKTGNSV